MTSEKDIEEIKRKAKESAEKYFGEKSEEVEKELEKETTLGSPENLIKPDDKED